MIHTAQSGAFDSVKKLLFGLYHVKELKVPAGDLERPWGEAVNPVTLCTGLVSVNDAGGGVSDRLVYRELSLAAVARTLKTWICRFLRTSNNSIKHIMTLRSIPCVAARGIR